MPSIFVWMTECPPMVDKTDEPEKSSTLQYYSGSNWFLEEHTVNNTSVSYQYTNQIMISHNSQHILVYSAVKMPHNWIGSDLLEVCEVPYRLIKEDSYATLEQLGQWMRCTVHTVNIVNIVNSADEEYTRILQWITPTVKHKVPYNILLKSRTVKS